MPYKVLWRVDPRSPLRPEVCDDIEQARSRARELCRHYGSRVRIEVWDEDETWQVVSAAGIAEWVFVEAKV
jgi:hypothetical protein